MPTWGEFIFNINGGEGCGQSKTQILASNFFFVLGMNIISRNPAGLNDAIDLIISGAFGARMGAAIAAIDALPDTAAITIPNEILTSNGANVPQGVTVVLKKPILQLLAAELKMTKSMVQLIASYNLNYNLTHLQTSWASADGKMPEGVKNFFKTAPSIVASKLLGDRSQRTRDAAKATMFSALDTIETATTTLLTAGYVEGWITAMGIEDISKIVPQSITADTQKQIDIYRASLTRGKVIAKKLRDSINNNTSMFVDYAAFMDGTIVTKDISLPTDVNGETAIVIKPGALYIDDVFNPAKLIDSSAKGFNVYSIIWKYIYGSGFINDGTKLITGDQAANPNVKNAFLKVNIAQIEKVFPSYTKVFSSDEYKYIQLNGYFPGLTGGIGPAWALSATDWLILKYFRGE